MLQLIEEATKFSFSVLLRFSFVPIKQKDSAQFSHVPHQLWYTKTFYLYDILPSIYMIF